MKKVISFFLLSLFLYCTTGIFIGFKVQQYQVRKEIKKMIKSRVPENELIAWSFHPDSEEYAKLDWIENKEFRYKGQMFDIVRRSVGPDGTEHFLCVNDKQEEKLFANLDQLVQTQMNSAGNSNNGSKNVLKLFSQLYFCNVQQIAFLFTSRLLLGTNTDFPLYLEPTLESAAQPPEPPLA